MTAPRRTDAIEDTSVRRAPRCGDDQGAVIVEAAFIAPVLFTFFMAIFEFGLLMRDSLTVNNGAADGAKYGAVQGPYPLSTGETADYTIIKTIRADLSSMNPAAIERVIIFRAGPSSLGAPLAQVPAACKTATTSLPGCNVYVNPSSFLQLQLGNSDYFKCLSAGQPACGWNPELRANGPKVANIDYLGVYIKLNRTKVTGLFPVASKLESAAVSRLEPGSLT